MIAAWLTNASVSGTGMPYPVISALDNLRRGEPLLTNGIVKVCTEVALLAAGLGVVAWLISSGYALAGVVMYGALFVALVAVGRGSLT